MKTDICIIGAGPAGLFAAIWAAQAGLRRAQSSRAKTLIVERNPCAARKLLRTGRTRCNLTHSGSVQDFLKAYGASGRFLRHCLYEFSADDLRKYFAARGLRTKVEEDGCVFPVTDRATDVAAALLDHAKELSVQFMYGRCVQAIRKENDFFTITTDKNEISAKAVIIATGGVTWPFTGSTGDGYKFAKALGHTVVEPKAALCPLLTAESWPANHQGVGIPDVVIKTLVRRCGKVENRKFNARGPLMFTAEGIGGPAVFDLSRLITDLLPDYDNPLRVTIDLLPQYDSARLDKEIIEICSQHPKKTVAAIVAQFVPKSPAAQLCEIMNLSDTTVCSQLTKNRRRALVQILKALPLSIVAAAPIDEATVTCGGVSTDEIDPKTMESKLCRGLYFAGEVINVDGPCGGFNLQIAFSTAHLAGQSAAKNISSLPPRPEAY
jgi:predicted Rossmann fold flavoprotein